MSSIEFLVFLAAFFYAVLPSNGQQDCVHGIEAKGLRPLQSFANDLTGLFHDHWATTWDHESHPDSLANYRLVQRLGLVLDPRHRKECECAVEVLQLYEEQAGLGGTLEPFRPGLFGRMNHKLVLKSQRRDDAIDSYLLTGERLFCAPKYGQCGASVPLYEWHVAAEDDSLFTTNTSLKNTLGVMNKGVLCYIWPLDYKSETLAPPKRPNAVGDPMPVQGQVREPTSASIGVVQQETCSRLEVSNGEWSLSALIATPGTKATLTCLPGFFPNGTTTAVCQKKGNWLPKPSSVGCVCARCPAFSLEGRRGQIAYNTRTPVQSDDEKQKLYSVGTTASLLCPDQMDVAHQSADTVICTNEGWLPAEFGRCERVCPPISSFPNGNVVYTDGQGFDQLSYTNATIATGVCLENARLVNGTGIAVCRDGEWEPKTLGSCHLPTCPSPTNVGDGHLLHLRVGKSPSRLLPDHFYSGTTLRLQCRDGAKIVGATESKCNPSGEWEPSLGRCE